MLVLLQTECDALHETECHSHNTSKLGIVPAVRPELVCIVAIDFCATLHDEAGPAHYRAFGYEDGLFAIRTASYGQNGVPARCS